MSETRSSIIRIAKYTIVDQVRQKSFIMMFVICALFILLVRNCSQGGFIVNGQTLDDDAVIRVMLKAVFHMIAVGTMLLAGLLSMRVFKRDREEGMQSCILSKPITRWQYVAGKILGLWVLSVVFMFILHSVVFIMISIHLKVVSPEYLMASLLSSFNLFFVVVAVLLFSLLMPDIIAFLCVMGIGIVSFVAEGIVAASQSQLGQAMLQQSGSASDVSRWKVIYYLWPKLSGIQQFASSLISREGFHGFLSIYPFINILIYCLILGALLFWRFRHEDII
ncbi:MAG: ABC transporter permease subunit [Smithella sp.]|nr:ABC transporter permease subunit [Smithella sp.]HOU49647.1 ABC transporter permease subunit [Smithella sp.]HQG64501.1 ABC transporter permease subunit [Smithella sp.]